MEMKTIDHLPSGGVIGAKEVQKGIKDGKIKRVIVAKNCPDWLVSKMACLSEGQASGIALERFNGNARELGTALGKPFAVAVAGFEE
ncbi:MAG: ribosomal L7Ae/L30e/S12e/Gadd45 family protein [Candidatus Aenigmatarchaeota archaeon]